MRVLAHAVHAEIPGTFNVAGDGVMMLSQAVRRLEPTVPRSGRPFARRRRRLGESARMADFSPEQLGFLTFGRGIDTARMRDRVRIRADLLHRGGLRRLRCRDRPPAGPGRAGRRRARAAPWPSRPRPAWRDASWLTRRSSRSAPAVAPVVAPAAPGRRGRVTDPGSVSPLARSRDAVTPKPAAPEPAPAADPDTGEIPVRETRRTPTTARGPLAAGRHHPRRLAGRPPDRRGAGLRRRLGAQLAEFLAFLRRRLTGDYDVDQYGFDPEITERLLLAAVRPLAEKWFRIEVRGAENIPAEGGALVVSNHSGTLPVDALMTMFVVHDADRPLPAAARRRPGLPAAVRQHVGPQGRRHPGLQRGRRADARRRRAGRGLARGLQGHRQAVQRALQAPALRPRRVRRPPRCAPACRSCRSRWSAPRRSTRSSATCPRSPGCSASPTCRSRRSSRWLGPLGHGAAALEVADGVRRADPHRRLRRRRGRRPDAGLQRHRPGARDHPAVALHAAGAARSFVWR